MQIERAHHPDPGEHRRAAVLSDQDQRLDRYAFGNGRKRQFRHGLTTEIRFDLSLAIRQPALCLTKKRNFVSPDEDRKRESGGNEQSQ